jgi:hypothetical protein
MFFFGGEQIKCRDRDEENIKGLKVNRHQDGQPGAVFQSVPLPRRSRARTAVSHDIFSPRGNPTPERCQHQQQIQVDRSDQISDEREAPKQG